MLRIQLDKENQPLYKFLTEKAIIENIEIIRDIKLSGAHANRNIEIPRKETQVRIPKK